MDGSPRRSDAARFKIEELLDSSRRGQIRVPRFQRGLRWIASDVEMLFDSIYQGFPIGTLLFWRRPAPAGVVELGPIRIDAEATSEALWVVDGQQRITSLAAALLPVPPHRYDSRFELSFDLTNEKFVKPSTAESETRIPVRAAFDLNKVLSWLRDRDLKRDFQDRAFRLADRLRNYEIPAYIVTTGDEGSLRKIFDRTNTFGKRMTRAEVFHALHSSGAPAQESDLRTLADDVGSLGFGEFDDNTLLFCVLAVRDPDVLRDFHTEFDGDESPDETFKHGVPENEFAMMRWAGRLGLAVPASELRPSADLGPLPRGFDRFDGKNVYVVRRFDRTPDGPIHIEDVNQVIGNWSEDKYRGATYEGLGRLVAALCGPDDFIEYIRRLVFIAGIGNEDAHLKNWSLWYPDGISPRLSPAYDLVSTIQYDDLSRGPALKLREHRSFASFDLPAIGRCARLAGVEPGLAEQSALETAAAIRETVDSVRDSPAITGGFVERLRDHQRNVPIFRQA